MAELVQGRECGECWVCCAAPAIDDPQLAKPAGVTCANCTTPGCAIYAARPRACADFHCGWRRLPLLGEAWRPDRSGLLIVFDDADVPEAYADKPGLKFVVLMDDAAILAREPLQYLAGLIHAGVPVFVAVPGGAGRFGTKAFLNRRLEPHVARDDGDAMAAELRRALATLRAGPFEAAG